LTGIQPDGVGVDALARDIDDNVGVAAACGDAEMPGNGARRGLQAARRKIRMNRKLRFNIGTTDKRVFADFGGGAIFQRSC